MSNSNSKIPSVDTKPDMIKELKEIVDSNESSSSTMQEKRNIPKKHKIRRKTSIRPIIMLLSLCLFLGFIVIDEKIPAFVKIEATIQIMYFIYLNMILIVLTTITRIWILWIQWMI